MTRVFEGVQGYWPGGGGSYEERFRLLLTADTNTGLVYVLAAGPRGGWIREQQSFRIAPMRGTGSGSAQRLGHLQMRSDQAFAAFLDSLSPPWPGFSFLPGFSLDVPGVSRIRDAGGWSDLTFGRVAGAAIDLSTANFSKLSFKNVDFREAVIAGTRFSGSQFENCQFGPQQLVGGRLDGTRFVGQQLRDLDLSGVTLEGAELTGTNLSNCQLTNADCRNVVAQSVKFIDCDCSAASFDGMRGTTLEFVRCDLTDATFERAQMDRVSFAQSTLRRTSFKEARLFEASFAKTGAGTEPRVIDDIDLDAAELAGADFTGIDLAGKVRHARAPRFGASVHERTKLVRATFNLSLLGSDGSFVDATDATIVYDIDPAVGIEDFKAQHALLPRMELARFRLRDADFSFAHMPAARFGNADLRDAKFVGAILEGADFSGATLDGAIFASATLFSANFTSAWMLEAKFEDTRLGDTNFSSAMLVAVNFAKLHGRNLAGVNFSNACLALAQFNAVVVTSSGSKQTSFAGACLAGADFENARLADAVLTNAQVAGDPGELTVAVQGHSPMDIEYGATRIAPSNTGRQTICPDGNSGPCPMPRLLFRPVRPVWPG